MFKEIVLPVSIVYSLSTNRWVLAVSIPLRLVRNAGEKLLLFVPTPEGPFTLMQLGTLLRTKLIDILGNPREKLSLGKQKYIRAYLGKLYGTKFNNRS